MNLRGDWWTSDIFIVSKSRDASLISNHLLLGDLLRSSGCSGWFRGWFLIRRLLVANFLVRGFLVALASLWSGCWSLGGWLGCRLNDLSGTWSFHCRGLGSLEHFHDLLFIDEECSDDALAQASVAQDTSESTWNGLKTTRHAWSLAGTCRGDSLQLLLALSAFRDWAWLLHVQVHQTTAGSANTKMKIEKWD